jgi:GNAT superfamily N-acetyltransferase
MATSEQGEVSVRAATLADTGAVADLLADLGYPTAGDVATKRLGRLLATGHDPVYLAMQDDQAVGLMAMHFTEMLHVAGPVARITTLVVRDGGRGQGVGKRLIAEADRMAREAGCYELELTTGLRRTQAQAFYEGRGMGRSIKYSFKYQAH